MQRLAVWILVCSLGAMSACAKVAAPAAVQATLPRARPAPPPAPPLPPVLGPDDTDAVLVCDGTYSQNGFPSAQQRATLELATTGGVGWRAVFDAPMLSNGTGIANAQVGAYNANYGGDEHQTFESHTNAERVDVTDYEHGKYVEGDSHHFVLVRASGKVLYADSSMFKVGFIGTCHKQTPADESALAQDKQRQALAERRQEIADNPRLAIALHMPFLNAPVCDNLRTQLIRFAREPAARDEDWERFLDRVTSTAHQAGCLP